LALPSTLVDQPRVSELRDLAVRDGQLALGAATPQREVETSALVRERCPVLEMAIQFVGHPQIRSRGTVGGSLAHADPSAELPCLCVALGASVILAGPSGRRTLSVEDFVVGPYTTAREPAEVLTDIVVPVGNGAVSAFAEFSRRHGDFAMMSVAATVEFAGATVSSARIVASGVGVAPTRLEAVEGVVMGTSLADHDVEHAAALAPQGLFDAGDLDVAYRSRLVVALVSEVLERVARGR
jgi:CO/xanthine dehydrogenase FAD-binding subunit